jgi:peptide/nickel transport system substrate-binding protein
MDRRTFVKGAGAVTSLLAAPALAQDLSGKILKFVPQANLSSLDPVWTTATVTSNHGYYVYDTLFGLDMSLKVQPQMAEGYEVSPDGRVYRIKLREGLKFHDGSPVRSIDCTSSLKRWSQRDTFGQLLSKVVDSYVVVDDRSFEIRLTRPFPHLLAAIAKADTPPFMMTEAHATTDPRKQITEVMGSGPYKFIAKEYNSGSLAVYEKFDGYKPRNEPPSRNAGGKVAHFERIEWRIITDPSTAASALIKGEVDWWERPAADLHPLLAKSPNITREATDPTGRMAILRFNALHPPFDNPAVRKAIRLAVNQEDYMRATQGDDTSAWKTCRNMWGIGTPYHKGEFTDLMPQNLDQARAALKASGYANEKVVIINPTDFPDIGPLGLVSHDLLKKLGMNVDLVDSDWGTVVQRRSNREGVDKGGWSMFHTTGPVIGWSNPALNFMTRGQGAAGWFGWWSNPKAEELTQEWLAATDDASQSKAAVELGRLTVEEAGTIPLGQFTIKTAYRKNLSGMLPGSAPYPWGLKRI